MRSCSCTCNHLKRFISDFGELKPFSLNVYSKIVLKRTLGSRGSNPVGPQFKDPNGICVDPLTKNILVCDSHNHRIQILDPNGKWIKSFGSRGSGQNQFRYPYGICSTDDRVLVSDHGNKRIQVFDHHSFQPLYSIPLPYEYKPRFVTCSPRGDILVTTNQHRILQVDQTGIVKSFGQLDSAEGISIDSRGRIIVSDCTESRLQILDPDGKCISSLTNHELIKPFDIHADEHIFVADLSNRKILIFSLEGGLIKSIPCKKTRRNGTRASVSPRGICRFEDRIIATHWYINNGILVYSNKKNIFKNLFLFFFIFFPSEIISLFFFPFL